MESREGNYDWPYADQESSMTSSVLPQDINSMLYCFIGESIFTIDNLKKQLSLSFIPENWNRNLDSLKKIICISEIPFHIEKISHIKESQFIFLYGKRGLLIMEIPPFLSTYALRNKNQNLHCNRHEYPLNFFCKNLKINIVKVVVSAKSYLQIFVLLSNGIIKILQPATQYGGSDEECSILQNSGSMDDPFISMDIVRNQQYSSFIHLFVVSKNGNIYAFTVLDDPSTKRIFDHGKIFDTNQKSRNISLPIDDIMCLYSNPYSVVVRCEQDHFYHGVVLIDFHPQKDSFESFSDNSFHIYLINNCIISEHSANGHNSDSSIVTSNLNSSFLQQSVNIPYAYYYVKNAQIFLVKLTWLELFKTKDILNHALENFNPDISLVTTSHIDRIGENKYIVGLQETLSKIDLVPMIFGIYNNSTNVICFPDCSLDSSLSKNSKESSASYIQKLPENNQNFQKEIKSRLDSIEAARVSIQLKLESCQESQSENIYLDILQEIKTSYIPPIEVVSLGLIEQKKILLEEGKDLKLQFKDLNHKMKKLPNMTELKIREKRLIDVKAMHKSLCNKLYQLLKIAHGNNKLNQEELNLKDFVNISKPELSVFNEFIEKYEKEHGEINRRANSILANASQEIQDQFYPVIDEQILSDMYAATCSLNEKILKMMDLNLQLNRFAHNFPSS